VGGEKKKPYHNISSQPVRGWGIPAVTFKENGDHLLDAEEGKNASTNSRKKPDDPENFLAG